MLFRNKWPEELEIGKEEAGQGAGVVEVTEETEKTEDVGAETEPRTEDTSPMSTGWTPAAILVNPPRSATSSLCASTSSLPLCLASPDPPPPVSVMSVSPGLAGISPTHKVVEKEEIKQAPPLDMSVFKSPLRPVPTSLVCPSFLPCLPPPSLPSLRPPHTEDSPAKLPSPGSSIRYLSLPSLLCPTPATPKAQEVEHLYQGLALKLQRKEQQEAARRGDMDQQELAKRPGMELNFETTAYTNLQARNEMGAVEKKAASSNTLETEESARIMSLLKPAMRRGSRGRKPKPKKILVNFLSDTEGDEDDSPYPPVAVKKKTLVKAKKKCDMFDEVIISESEEVDDPTAELKGVNPYIFDSGWEEPGDMMDSVRKALEQQNALKDELSDGVMESGESKEKVKIKTFQKRSRDPRISLSVLARDQQHGEKEPEERGEEGKEKEVVAALCTLHTQCCHNTCINAG